MSGWPFDVIDAFAGPGGWSEGLRALGMRDLGIEFDADACATRYANGHASWHVDITAIDPTMFAGVPGFIASPPCPDWSAAGSKLGRSGKTGWLVDIVPQWVEAIQPEWIACEQVPGALGVWREHAHRYRELGYSVWCGVLNSADFGVPQTRRRAVLVASKRVHVTPPEPTHSRTPSGSLFDDLAPWVSMADALGWASVYADDEPAPTIAFGHDAAAWTFQRPATTVMGDSRIWPPGHKINQDDIDRLGEDEATERYGDRAGTDAIRMTPRDALVLQSFRPDYIVTGSQTSQFGQIGNAVPPLLAQRIVEVLVR